MKNKEITKNTLRKVKELIEDVKNMSEEEFQKVLNSMIKFHQYSFFNQLILSFHNCSQVAGYKKWKELGRTVKKGEKAIWILAPYIKKIKVKKKNEDKEEEGEEEIIQGFFSVPVFDISQTEGKPIEGEMTEKTEIKFDKIKNFALREGFSINFKPLKIAEGGHIIEKNITLNKNLQEKDWTGTLIHETTSRNSYIPCLPNSGN